jgi:two-component system, LytTR family, response regulator
MKRIRALVTEDESLARASLRRLIRETGWIELVGEAADGRTAVEMINRDLPDLLFLDVVLPELSGLEVLERIHHRPLVVFTTAYERYAVAAFELEALDYLVKPFSSRRFHETMQRVRQRIMQANGPSVAERVQSAFAAGPLERVFVRVGARVVPLLMREVIHFQAEGDYVRAVSRGSSHLLSVSLAELEGRLASPFVRIHRCHIVNLNFVEKIERHDERRLMVFLPEEIRIVASRAGSARLRELML